MGLLGLWWSQGFGIQDSGLQIKGRGLERAKRISARSPDRALWVLGLKVCEGDIREECKNDGAYTCF